MSMTSTVSNTVHPEEYLHLVDTVISLYITQRIDIADMNMPIFIRPAASLSAMQLLLTIRNGKPAFPLMPPS